MEVNIYNIQRKSFKQFAFYKGQNHLTVGKLQLVLSMLRFNKDIEP